MSTHKGGTNITKDVIYIDVDDEITGIIDKVRGSDKKIVALVLPKRAAVLQSVVNMKLLRRAATESKKNLVLITSESGLLPLAGSVGVHVAKSLNSRPEVPEGPEKVSDKAESVEEPEDGDDDQDAAVDRDKTVGELSGADPIPVMFAPNDSDEDEESIELDDEDIDNAQEAKPDKKSKQRNKKFKIPNFNKFRLMLMVTGLAFVVLVMFVYAAVAIWPKAKITIKTDSQAVNSSIILTLKTEPETKLDADKAVIPAQVQATTKTITQDVPATGQLNKGDKATGSVDMTTKDCTAPYSVSPIPAGTGVTANSKTYITGGKATFSPTTFDFGTSCWSYKASGVAITAQTGGSAWNTASATFTVAGHSDVSATGSASGGTDNIVKVVSQADVDAAKQKITQQDTAPITQELKSALISRGLYALDSTMSVGAPDTKLSAEVNTEAETLTVTQTINYTMYGVKQDDLKKIVEKDVSQKIDTKKQAITDYGLDNAVFGIQGINPDGASVSMQTTAVAGAQLNKDVIKKQVAGKKAGDAKQLIGANPGVTDVTVEYSPFWVSSIPKKTDKITVIIEAPKVKTANEESSP